MKIIASRLLLTISCAVLVALIAMFSGHPLEYCGQPDVLRPRADRLPVTEACRPTPAPPQNVVVVQVETDRPGLEVGWAAD
jgi:hypothetical protein